MSSAERSPYIRPRRRGLVTKVVGATIAAVGLFDLGVGVGANISENPKHTSAAENVVNFGVDAGVIFVGKKLYDRGQRQSRIG